ncbi:uncharacterized protein LOC119968606 [Scyliorhinus canicula]|uniref:uncharacterized protein LOC119968606 n=1 Tax=Scyliorhinus canicula TaxID=7830 RepID=UPI0018F3FDDD|nr:uncharacterized protein LOC119968606 [Scyliorhinus canicula]
MGQDMLSCWFLTVCCMVLVLWVPIDQVKSSSVGREGSRRSSSNWSRKAFEMLNGKVLCQRRAGSAHIRDLLRKGDTSIDTYCKYFSGLRRNQGGDWKRGDRDERRGFAKEIEARSGLRAVQRSECLNAWEREMLKAFVLTASPKSSFSGCDAEKETTAQSFRQRLNLHLLQSIITLPLIQVSWKEDIELEFRNYSVEKELRKEVNLLGAFLVFFLGDKEKDWLQSEGRNFSVTLRKGKWSKYEPVCVTNDSNYIILELPTKACKWFYSRSLRLSMQMWPVTVDGRNEFTASGSCAKALGTVQCQESLAQKLLFGWDDKRYTRLPPVILVALKNRRSTKNKEP